MDVLREYQAEIADSGQFRPIQAKIQGQHVISHLGTISANNHSPLRGGGIKSVSTLFLPQKKKRLKSGVEAVESFPNLSL